MPTIDEIVEKNAIRDLVQDARINIATPHLKALFNSIEENGWPIDLKEIEINFKYNDKMTLQVFFTPANLKKEDIF